MNPSALTKQLLKNGCLFRHLFQYKTKRMRTLLFLFLLCFVAPKCWSQQLIVDSLHQLLLNETDPYEQMDLHLGLTRASVFSRDDVQCEKSIQLVLDLSEKHEWPEASVIAYVFKAVNELNKGSGSQVLYEYVQKAIKLANQIDDQSGLAFANYHLAEYYIFDKNDPEKGLEIIAAALKKINASVAHQHIGNIYKTQGVAHSYLGDDEATLKSYQQALAYFEKVAEDPFIVERLNHKSALDTDDGKLNTGQVLNYLSNMLAEKGDFKTALAYAQRAIGLYNSVGAVNQEAWSIRTAAYVYQLNGELDQAIEKYQEAIKIFEATDNRFRLIGSQLAIGELFFRNKDYEAAFENFGKGKSNSVFIKDTVYLIRAMGWMGKTELRKGNVEEALKVTNEALIINEVSANDGERYKLLEILSEIHEIKGDYKLAIELNKEAIVLNKKTKGYRHLQKNYTHLAQLFSIINQIDSARHYGNLALENGKQYASADQKISLQKVLSDVYEKAGDYPQALKFHRKYFELFKKSYDDRAQGILKNEQVRQDVAGIEAEKKQVETMANLLASRNQLYLILALGLGFVLLLGSYLFYQLRKTKQQLERQNTQLHQLNITKDKFFGIIAHDIRSPIVALDGVGEQMEYYLEKRDTPKLERLATRVDDTAKRLSGLLDNLLNWALLQQGVIPFHPKSINVKEVGENTFQMFKNNADTKSISLELNIDPLEKVFADESALNTILRNLVSNAIKFTPAGGTVSLSTETKSDKIFIKINDTGTGISAEKLTKLFSLEKQSAKGTFGEKGTGLGLTLVKELVELNNGSIDVTSVLEQGSSFLVGLPMNG